MPGNKVKPTAPAVRAACDTDGPDLQQRPEKKARKQRPCFSCDAPCSNCVRRQRLAYCTWARGAADSPAPTPARPARPSWSSRSSRPSLDFQGGGFLAGQAGPPGQPAEGTEAVSPSLSTANSIAHTISHETCIETASTTSTTASHATSNATSQSTTNAISNESSGVHTEHDKQHHYRQQKQQQQQQQQQQHGENEAATVAVTDDDDKGNSYGTLVMSRGGRSKYLGPTAGSEWLKDVQQLQEDTANTPSVTRCPSPEPEVAEQHQHHQQSALVSPPVHSMGGVSNGGGNAGVSIAGVSIAGGHGGHGVDTSPIAFPINASAAQIRTRDLLAHLPPANEAWALVESYYRYCAWHHDIAPKPRFKETFDRVYSYVTPGAVSPASAINFQEVALVFMIMAKGTVYNIEMPMDDPSAEEWQHLSEMALVKGNFLSNNTIAGVQTLHIMAHKNFQSDKGRRDDKAWLLWGLAVRMIQAMGLHRDGARWNLPPDIVEERRKVFWEVNAADIFQAHCFSRPATINPDHCDTEFPSEPRVVPSEKGYFELRFELAQISNEILNMAMKARRSPYSEVAVLDQKLRKYEQNLPYYIRCRSALLAMVSRYPSPEDAIAATPEPARRDMPLSFQQSNLALNLCETVINLHRPYYAKALYDDTGATDKSIYAPSFYAVIERCAMILAIVSDIHSRYPAISTRQWNFWYHVFGSGLCLGTLVLRHPTHAMANFVLLQIDTSIALFSSLVQNGANTPRYQRNLQWLQRLRARAAAKMEEASQQQGSSVTKATGTTPDMLSGSAAAGQDDRDVELIGWRTRLIRQADQQQQQQQQHTTQQTIINGSSNGTMNGISNYSNLNTNTNNNGSYNQYSNHYSGGSSYGTAMATTDETPPSMAGSIIMPAMAGQVTLQSTDDVLREFWDPIMLHNLLEGGNDASDATQQFTSLMNSGPSWWEWDYGPSGS